MLIVNAAAPSESCATLLVSADPTPPLSSYCHTFGSCRTCRCWLPLRLAAAQFPSCPAGTSFQPSPLRHCHAIVASPASYLAVPTTVPTSPVLAGCCKDSGFGCLVGACRNIVYYGMVIICQHLLPPSYFLSISTTYQKVSAISWKY